MKISSKFHNLVTEGTSAKLIEKFDIHLVDVAYSYFPAALAGDIAADIKCQSGESYSGVSITYPYLSQHVSLRLLE